MLVLEERISFVGAGDVVFSFADMKFRGLAPELYRKRITASRRWSGSGLLVTVQQHRCFGPMGKQTVCRLPCRLQRAQFNLDRSPWVDAGRDIQKPANPDPSPDKSCDPRNDPLTHRNLSA